MAIPMFFKSVTPARMKSKPAAAPREPDAPDGEQSPKSDIVENPPPDMGHFTELLALLADRKGAGGDFGPHNVQEGHHVAFAAGSFSGAGKVSAVGRDGLHVTDSERREHRVHWNEVTGHYAGASTDAGPAQKEVEGGDAL